MDLLPLWEESSESVSPQRETCTNEEEDEDEEILEEDGMDGERLSLPKEDRFVEKLWDPRKPTKEELENHYIMGHIPYRNWCHICVEAMGRDRKHSSQTDKGEG